MATNIIHTSVTSIPAVGKDEIDSEAFATSEESVTGSQSKSPSSTRSGNDKEFHCDICNKSYSRHDLRDRHRRRCIAKGDRNRKSKQKSCRTCAQKKIRCSLTRPSCARCAQLGNLCQYPPGVMAVADVGEIGHLVNTPPMATAIQGQPCNIESTLSAPSQSTEMIKSVSVADTPGSMLDPNAHWPPFDFETMQFAENSIPDDPWSHLNETPGSSLPWNTDITHLPEFEPTNSETNAIQPPTSSLNSIQTSTSGQSISHFDIIQHLTENEPCASAPNVPSQSSPESMWLESSNEEECSMSVNLDNRLYSPSHLIFGHTFIAGLGHQIRTDSSSLCQEMLGHLREYPRLILDRDFWSPFVHHRLYRCSLGGMAPPMADALACVGAYASTVGSNSGLVDRMISQEREKLVRNFHSYTDTPEFCLAAMHAVCIYQIIGLFGDSFLPAAVKEPVFSNGGEERRQEFERHAELYSSFLLKMTRRLSDIHSKALHIHHCDENDWHQWKFMESLRRNFFFVHIINVLESQARKLNHGYFEPLNDNMIVRLPLPAPERMWRACSAEEWILARAQTLGPPRSDDEPTFQTLGHVLQLVHAGKVDVASLLPLTRMILASTIICPPEAES